MRRIINTWDNERDRLTYLKSQPLPKTDPYLLEKIKVRVILPFYYGGKLQTPEAGIVLIGRFDAGDLKSRGKVEIIE